MPNKSHLFEFDSKNISRAIGHKMRIAQQRFPEASSPEEAILYQNEFDKDQQNKIINRQQSLINDLKKQTPEIAQLKAQVAADEAELEQLKSNAGIVKQQIDKNTVSKREVQALQQGILDIKNKPGLEPEVFNKLKSEIENLSKTGKNIDTDKFAELESRIKEIQGLKQVDKNKNQELSGLADTLKQELSTSLDSKDKTIADLKNQLDALMGRDKNPQNSIQDRAEAIASEKDEQLKQKDIEPIQKLSSDLKLNARRSEASINNISTEIQVLYDYVDKLIDQINNLKPEDQEKISSVDADHKNPLKSLKPLISDLTNMSNDTLDKIADAVSHKSELTDEEFQDYLQELRSNVKQTFEKFIPSTFEPTSYLSSGQIRNILFKIISKNSHTTNKIVSAYRKQGHYLNANDYSAIIDFMFPVDEALNNFYRHNSDFIHNWENQTLQQFKDDSNSITKPAMLKLADTMGTEDLAHWIVELKNDKQTTYDALKSDNKESFYLNKLNKVFKELFDETPEETLSQQADFEKDYDENPDEYHTQDDNTSSRVSPAPIKHKDAASASYNTRTFSGKASAGTAQPGTTKAGAQPTQNTNTQTQTSQPNRDDQDQGASISSPKPSRNSKYDEFGWPKKSYGESTNFDQEVNTLAEKILGPELSRYLK